MAVTTTTSTATPPRPSSGPDDGLTSLLPTKLSRSRPLFDPEIVSRALRESFVKLNPVTLVKNPVMFVVEAGAALTTVFVARDIIVRAPGTGFGVQIALWLWFTVLFANFAEAMAEARGKAQADSLRKTKTDVMGKRLLSGGRTEEVPVTCRLDTAEEVSIYEAGGVLQRFAQDFLEAEAAPPQGASHVTRQAG